MLIAADYQAAEGLGVHWNMPISQRWADSCLKINTSVYNILADHIADHIQCARTLKSYQSGRILRFYVGSDAIIIGGGPTKTT